MRDVVVIGAGPAGSVASLILVRAGWHVTLVEQHAFPRDKVCGECLSALGMDVLRRLGLASVLLQMHPPALDQVLLHDGQARSVRMALPRPLWGISRLTLDSLLLHAARDAGAVIRQPARCEALGTDPLPSVRIRDLRQNLIQDLRPSWVLLADGRGSWLRANPRLATDFGLKAHFVDVPGASHAVELFALAGHYGGLAPIEGGRWNLAFSVPASRLRFSHGNLPQLFAAMAAENRTLSQRLATARRVTSWLVSPLLRFGLPYQGPPRVIPIGNAAAAIEPIGGEGMGLALRSAELAAEALELAEATGSPAPLGHLRRQFHALWRTRAAACRLAGRCLASSWLAPLAIQLLQDQESIPRTLLKFIGKDAPAA